MSVIIDTLKQATAQDLMFMFEWGILAGFIVICIWSLKALAEYMDMKKEQDWQKIKRLRGVCDHNVQLGYYCWQCQKEKKNANLFASGCLY